jgi:hypothetical protein
MIRKYICSLCKEEYYSIDAMLNHLRNSRDEIHSNIDYDNLDIYFDVLEIENLDSREWTDVKEKRIETQPIKTMPSVPEEYLPKGWIREAVLEYPYRPYYFYPKEQEYFCSEHKFSTKDLSEFLNHVLKEHSKDYDKVLKHVVFEQLKDKVSKENNRKTLETLVQSEIRKWLLKAEEREPEALHKHVEEHFNDILEYLKGNRTVCPYCGTEAIIKNQLHLDKIFYCLQKGAMQEDSRLKRKFEDYKQRYGYYPYMGEEKYLCEWDDTPVLLKLHSLLHIYQDHRGTFERLVKSGILSGELITFLYNKKYLNKETQAPILKAEENKEKLDLCKLPIKTKRQVNLSKSEDAFLKWLDKERTKKE